jgi:hypothetical protein
MDIKENNNVTKNIFSSYKKDIFSQCGEDGIIERIFEIIQNKNSWVVEFGAHDGQSMSNSLNLIKNHNWKAVLIEADSSKFENLKRTHRNSNNVTLFNEFVNFNGGGGGVKLSTPFYQEQIYQKILIFFLLILMVMITMFGIL